MNLLVELLPWIAFGLCVAGDLALVAMSYYWDHHIKDLP
jgi:hypothetical protein